MRLWVSRDAALFSSRGSKIRVGFLPLVTSVTPVTSHVFYAN